MATQDSSISCSFDDLLDIYDSYQQIEHLSLDSFDKNVIHELLLSVNQQFKERLISLCFDRSLSQG